MFSLLITTWLICHNYAFDVPQYPHIQLSENQTRSLMRQILSYSTNDICMEDMYDLNQWNNSQTITILNERKALVAEDCDSLNITNPDCLADCVWYSDSELWILLLLENTNQSITTFNRMISYYSMSSMDHQFSVQWFNAGNPSMCLLRNGTYCYTPALVDNGFQSMTITAHGCCVPGSCTKDDALKLLHNNDVCYELYSQFYGPFIEEICDPMPRELNKPGPIIVIAIFLLFFIFVIITSIIKQYNNEYNKDDNKNNDNTNWFVSSFNIQQSWSALTSARAAKNSKYNFLDGIRVWSMTWVIYGHSYVYWMVSGTSNLEILLPGLFDAPSDNLQVNPFDTPAAPSGFRYVTNQFYMIFAQYGFYSVDSFFWLSGFLGAFSIHRKCKKFGSYNNILRNCYLWIPLAFLARFLRIIPMMMYLTSIEWQLGDQLSYGYQVSSRSAYTSQCDNGWYKILFFYNNLLPEGEASVCMAELWYIQCDMQMFILLPFLVLLFEYKKILGILATLIPILICFIIRLYYAFYYDFQANTLFMMLPGLGYPIQHDGNFMDDSYFKPWTRMGPYFVGVLTMFFFIYLDEHRGIYKNFKLPKSTYFVTIILGCFTLGSLVIWPYDDVVNSPDEHWSLLSNQIYYALSRPVWGIGLSLIAFPLVYMSDHLGQKSLIKTILSCSVYQVIGKLTYLMYLLHMVVYNWWKDDMEVPAYYTAWTELLLICGIWCIVAFLALIIWLILERPTMNLTNTFLKCLMSKKKKQIHDDHDDDGGQLITQNKIGFGSLGYEQQNNDDTFMNDRDQTLKKTFAEH